MALDFAAGCIGGIAGVLVGHPLDTVKVRLQTQDYKNPIYHGTWHTLTTILKEEKVRGLYRGVSSPMGGVALVNAVVFGVYGNIQRIIGDDSSLMSHAYAGGLAGFLQSFICSPMELCKTRLQVQKTRIYKSSVDCLIKTAKSGWRNFYKGLSITIVREIPAFSSYFYTYEALMQGRRGTTVEMLCAGGVAGCVSWFVAYPIDVIKTRVQSDGMPGTQPKYRSAVHCFRVSLAEEGPSSLFRGLSSTLIRAFPVNGVTFVVVTWIFKLHDKIRSEFVIAKQDVSYQSEQPDAAEDAYKRGGANSFHVHDHDRIHLNANFSY